MNNYNELLEKLNQFIRKYYTNKLLQGIILASIIIIVYLLTILLAEYIGHFSVKVRTFIFIISIIILIFNILLLVLYPIFKLLKLGKVLTYSQAANIISNHFKDIKDQIINVLELGDKNNNVVNVNPLIVASINQKIKNISIYKFESAIDFKKNIKYLKFLFLILILAIVSFIGFPDLYKASGSRLINYENEYIPPAPFKFILLNDSLDIKKGEDFTIKAKLIGKAIPDQLFINFGGTNYLMNELENNEYSYTIKTVNNGFEFKFESVGYESHIYNLQVLPVPNILSFKVLVQSPTYTGIQNKEYLNTGDITIAEGSTVRWSFEYSDLDALYLKLDTVLHLANQNDDLFSFEQRFLKSSNYSILGTNKYFEKMNLVQFKIDVIQDRHPEIYVSKQKDSLLIGAYFYTGEITDDYGFKKLTFNYKIGEDSKAFKSQIIPIKNTIKNQVFFYSYNFADLNLQKGQNIKYYFEVFDNDNVNGFKSTKSTVYNFKVPDKEEIKQQEKALTEAMENKVDKSKKLINDLKNAIDQYQKRNVEENLSQWEKKQLLDNILTKQQKLENFLKDLKTDNLKKNILENTFDKKSEELLQKQKEIQELFESLIDDDLKKLLDEINKLRNQLNNEQIKKMNQNLEMNYEDLEKQLDRNMELLKRYNIEKKLENINFEMYELKEDIQKQNTDLDKNWKNKDKSDLVREQQEIQEKINELKQQYQETLDENNELKNKFNLDSNLINNFENINEKLEQGEDQIKENKKRKTKESLEESIEQTEQLISKMEKQLQENTKETQGENEDDLRQILDNLINFSFQQESLMERTKSTYSNSPKYIQIQKEQTKLKDDFEIINDSLYALSQRAVQISSPVLKELKAIKTNLMHTDELLEKRRNKNAGVYQQYVMTSTNNLALLLSEILDNMSKMKGQGGKGKSSKNKKSKGKPNFSEIKDMQKGLKQQLQEMLDQMKQGMNKGNKNQQLAKSLAKQEMMQKMLQDLMNNSSFSPETQKLLNEINRLAEETKRDIINDNITPETLMRQEQIKTRLLEAENAEKEREQDKKRKSKEADDYKRELNKKLEEDWRKKNGINEMLNLEYIDLNNYFKIKFDRYLQKIYK